MNESREDGEMNEESLGRKTDEKSNQAGGTAAQMELAGDEETRSGISETCNTPDDADASASSRSGRINDGPGGAEEKPELGQGLMGDTMHREYSDCGAHDRQVPLYASPAAAKYAEDSSQAVGTPMRAIKTGPNAWTIVFGVIAALIGVVVLAEGLWFVDPWALGVFRHSREMVGIALGSVGVVLLVVALICVILEVRGKQDGRA